MSLSGIDWPGLLSWSTKYHDRTKGSEFKPMDDDTKEWIEKALKEAMGGAMTDPNVVMQEAIDNLKKLVEEETPKSDSMLAALAVLDSCSEYPDCPRNLEKFGGTKVLLDVTHVNDLNVQKESLRILASMLANNPEVQTAALSNHEAMEKLCKLILQTGGRIKVGSAEKDLSDSNPFKVSVESAKAEKVAEEEVRLKALSGLASLVRGCSVAEKKFVEGNGLQILVRSRCFFLPQTEEEFRKDPTISEAAVRLCGKAAGFARSCLLEVSREEDVSVLSEAMQGVYSTDSSSAQGDIQCWELLALLSRDLLMRMRKGTPEGFYALLDRRLRWILKSEFPEDFEEEKRVLIDALKLVRG